MAGFAYSGALIEAGWEDTDLCRMKKFLWKPKAYAPATKMSFAGVKKAEDRGRPSGMVAHAGGFTGGPAV